MPNRRDFLKGAAGIVFTSCGLKAQQPSQATRRREIRMNGRRIKTIDVHAHCTIPEATALMGNQTPPGTLLMGPDRLRAMDQQGIDMQALSINPYWYGAERDLVTRVIKIQNEKLAELCAAQPDRFVAFATVALQYPDLAVQQLEEGITKLGLRGASLGAIINGEELSSPRFEPFWEKAEALGVPIFIHPQGVPELQKRLQGNGILTNVIANPLETTIALSHLIFEGVFDRYPALKICAAHGGGYLPSYADRSDHGCVTFPTSCKTALKKQPTEYLKQIYVDSLVFTPEALRHLVAQVGANQIVMGTDYPYPWTATSVDHILKTPTLSDAEREAILYTTAAKLLRVT